MTLSELQEIKEQELASRKKTVVRVCMAAGCASQGGDELLKNLKTAVEEAGLEEEVEIRGVGCMKLCCQGPLAQVDPNEILYRKVEPGDAKAIVEAIKTGSAANLSTGDPKSPFFSKQVSVVLGNSGEVDPERIESYIAADGYVALRNVLREMDPAEVVREIMESGLRGRGGGGYPTGLKWQTVAKATGDKKYIVCNADEGDPGAFMDRTVLESDPHSIIEGMTIAAYAVGAQQGYIYVRAEYPLAIERLQKAIKQAKKHGLLGAQIMDGPINFSIDLRIGAGAFVCGEETALMASIEGKRGTPRPRPPFPAERGLWGCPTLINNVETFANIAPIIRRGAEWFAGIGTEKSKGTKVFALAGKITNTGIVEVPMGMPLREIIEDMGGGAPDGGKVKAVQTGGPSGGCIPSQHLDTSVDYESLAKLGSIMGSGGMIVMDESTNMVDVARFFMEFCRDESCGKCIPCRAGTVQMHNMLTKIIDGKATERDIEKLEELCEMVKATSLCGLGQTAPNPVLSTLRFFRNEYEALLQEDPFAAKETPASAGETADA
jgi:bidirectional [NiFe] hydrogenase diaphorase subunit